MVEKVKCSDVEKSNKNEQIQQLINLVPNNKKAQAKQLVSVVMEQRAIYSGPLPPAQQFSEYEAILPGSAERILRMAEKEGTEKDASLISL